MSSGEECNTWMPMAFRCISFCSSRTRPEAARSALEGTQPLFTQVPPMSWPSITAVLRPCSYTQNMLTSLLAHKNGFLLGGTYRRHCQEIQQQGLRKTDDAMSREATHALNSVQGSSMAADAAANDDQVIVVFALCCCYCQAPCTPPTALPAHSMGAAGT